MAPKLSHHIILEALFLLFLIQALFVKSESQFSKSLRLFHEARKGYTIEGLNHVKQYLEALGYYSIGGSNLTDDFDDSLESALKAYQQHYRLEITGRMDSDTMKKMSIPRCGVRDIFDYSNDGVKFITVANYSFFEGMPRWNKRQLTYKFRSSAHVISVRRLRPIITRALQKWAVVSDFTFREVRFFSRSDVVLGFHRRGHGDNYPFDGPGNVLAHAFAPQYGKLHFDADENWSSNNLTRFNQIDLESVSIHELGHILGLGHSRDPDAIMYAYYMPGSIKRDLSQDDIDGIRALYSH
ncbi:Eukaryotic aspartyl protease family protein [Hibiscus syriacus]|uniref:Eukaryotic aspartyl protease family protein n=1 Tax=Hibiscus syriacus TaxID=106335 RepID=A0A6A2ZSM5_HIBSY|nr:metalloendoproteinase 1-like [Hibiscus syriacus]KAE8694152.1 Eukaryotic aspartyl protease family protein [Hibiscus syriacus]